MTVTTTRTRPTVLPVLLLLLQLMYSGSVEAAMSASTASDASSTGNATVTTTASLCDAQLLFQKLYVLMPAINQCAMESDYFIQPSNLSFPSDQSLQKYCSSKNCSLLSQELDNAGLPSCAVPVGNTTMPFKVFFKNIKDYCDNLTQSSSSVPAPGADSAAVTHTWRAAVGGAVLAVLVLTVL